MEFDRRINELQLLRIFLLFLGVIGVIYILIKWLLIPLFEIALVPLLVSLFVSVMLEPAVVFMERKGMDRRIAVNVCFVVFHLVIIILIYIAARKLLFEKITDLPSLISEVFKSFDAGVKKILTHIQRGFPGVDVSERITKWGSALGDRMVEWVSSLFTYIFFTICLSPFMTYFLMRDRRTMMKKVLDIVPNKYFEMSVYLMRRIVDQFERYIRGKLVEMLIITLVIILFLMPLRPPFLVVQAVFAGVMNIIPYIGPIIGAIPGVIIALYSFPISKVIYVVVVYIVIARIIVDDMILVPFFFSHISELHPLTVIFAVAIGGEVGGAIGMIISIPVVMAVKIIVTEIYYYFKFKGRVPV